MAKKPVAPALFDAGIISEAAINALRKLKVPVLARNPVIFVTASVAALVTALWLRDVLVINGNGWFSGQIAVWLWFTVLFANFAEAVAEGRGKAQADALRRTRTDTVAKRLLMPDERDDLFEKVSALDLNIGDVVIVEANELIPADGEVTEGIASVNESAITGKSAPVIRESGGDRSAVTGGTMVLSDSIKVRVTAAPGSTFVDRMIALVEGAERHKTPNEIALSILLAGLTLIFLVTVVTLWGLAGYSGTILTVTVLAALLVTLIPTTIAGLLSAIGIAGMDRLIRFNVIATSGRAVEAAGDVDTLLLDKTGTVTFGNRLATRLIPAAGVAEKRARRSGAAVIHRRRDSGGTLDRRLVQGPLQGRGAGCREGETRVHSVLSRHPHFRRRHGRKANPQGRGRCGAAECEHFAGQDAAGVSRGRRPHLAHRRHAARGLGCGPDHRGDRAQGRGQARYQGPLQLRCAPWASRP